MSSLNYCTICFTDWLIHISYVFESSGLRVRGDTFIPLLMYWGQENTETKAIHTGNYNGTNGTAYRHSPFSRPPFRNLKRYWEYHVYAVIRDSSSWEVKEWLQPLSGEPIEGSRMQMQNPQIAYCRFCVNHLKLLIGCQGIKLESER